ncbi:hypothetical protein CABS01_03243 [Colletotrichum abscissum]|uniref:uncharacterized protein n=1 Tax=Colletotrichum abscissum TaxID=1671311 RepID=UPI0027D5A587|nr:uncharacterized protein CABS01_03243 [Colletotrichum abscissum]KAK1477941.1 hypothetical protein CABS01_03243 [Colletotrichum abscissum]
MISPSQWCFGCALWWCCGGVASQLFVGSRGWISFRVSGSLCCLLQGPSSNTYFPPPVPCVAAQPRAPVNRKKVLLRFKERTLGYSFLLFYSSNVFSVLRFSTFERCASPIHTTTPTALR